MKAQKSRGRPTICWGSTPMNANVERGTVNELLTLFTQEGAATCKATLLLMPTAFSPGWSGETGMLRPLVGMKGAVGQGVLAITSFANMTVPTLTQIPATGTIVPRPTMLGGVKGTLGWNVQ